MPEARVWPPPARLFIALWPGPVTRDAVARWQQAWEWPGRPAVVQRERLHLTLHFIGDVPAQRVPELAGALKVPFQPFELRLVRAALWRTGIAVLEPEHTPASLLRLHAALGAALASLELRVESRPFRAHVTLARRAPGARPPPGHPPVDWRVDDGYVLVRSLPGGSGYEVLQRFA